MTEDLLKSTFERSLNQVQNDLVKVHVVPASDIKSKNPSTKGGFNEVRFDANHEFACAYILIDEQLDYEIKLNILYHEYEHINHARTLGIIEIQRLKRQSVFDWIVKDEYEAFKCQLSSIKRLGNPLLKRLIERLNYRSRNDLPAYREALNKLKSEALWQECLALINC